MTKKSLWLTRRKLSVIATAASALFSAQSANATLPGDKKPNISETRYRQPALIASIKQADKAHKKTEAHPAASTCRVSASKNNKELNEKDKKNIYRIVRKAEHLESKELFEQAARQYLDAKELVAKAEGDCTINSGRMSLIYGTKLYRAFKLEEAEKQIKSGLDILRLNGISSKEICEEAAGGLIFLDEIYSKKLDSKSFADAFLAGWPLLEKCSKSQAEATKPRLFEIFIRLSLQLFNGYVQEETDAQRNERAELAFEALNNAYNVVGGKPTQMQMADILLKEGYFKYLMANTQNNKNRDVLLLRAKEATSQALRIHDELKKPDHAASSTKQLAYILDSLGEYEQADTLYKRLITRALAKPLRATSLGDDYTLFSGYAALSKDWNNGANFSFALLRLREWEYAALKKLLPSLTSKERLEYLNYFSASESLAARGLKQGIINTEEYLDAFLQLRYSLIESELIALAMKRQKGSAGHPAEITEVSKQMKVLDIGFTDQIRKSLKSNELFIQFVEATPKESTPRATASNKDVIMSQAFIVKASTTDTLPSAHYICEHGLCQKQLKNALHATSEGLADAPQQWQLLMDNLFTPSLIKEIRESEILYFGLDGFLQRIPVGIVRTYLNSKGLQSVRVIPVQNLADIGNESRTPGSGNSSIFYSPEFGSGIRCKLGDYCEKQWSTLSYSMNEGEAVSKIIPADKYFGVNASKSAILDVESPRILHISSHAGFKENIQSEGLSVNSGQEKELLLDGLYNLYIVASGANIKPAEASIITSSDLANLNLSGTSLVVVSACETGLGGTQRGYGLFGMHRVLSLVGVQSTLLSMWKVDDEATSILMSMFYENLKAGHTIDQSLANAQDKMSMDPKLVSRGWNHPYYWAGWQIAGKMSPVFKK